VGVGGGSPSSQVEVNVVFIVVYILVHRIVATIVQVTSRSRSRHWFGLLGSSGFGMMNSTCSRRGGPGVGIFVAMNALG
jgi:hypothetical protein